MEELAENGVTGHIPRNEDGLIEYKAHPFWLQKHCPCHDHDGTPRCCSCQRMESNDTSYVALDDGRNLCLECLDSAVIDTNECQPLYLDILDFYEGLNMEVKQQVPLLLVERRALNEAWDEEMHVGDSRTVSFRGVNSQEGYRHCDVNHDVEEGICQVLAHMWLESQMSSISPIDNASTSSTSTGSRSPFEGKLGDFSRYQIESDTSEMYGDSFRAGHKAVLGYGLEYTLDHIRMTGSFPK
ncbi:Protein DA1-related 1 [Forsythia ovata]|uniref:Protein DA1-related 1 n=1 Tax=Forsythia ovata TaxID=205694 RepID=A0ABD1RM46_9LAMI